MINPDQFSPFLSGNDDLKIIPYCPICETSYQNLDLKILEERDSGYLVYIKCQKCLNSILTFITTNNNGVSSFSLITDLTASDVIKLKENDYVSSDDVIEIYKLLESEENFVKKLTNS